MGWRFEGSTYSFRVAEGVERVGGLSGRRGGGLEVRVVHLQLPGGEGGWKGLGMERLEV